MSTAGSIVKAEDEKNISKNEKYVSKKEPKKIEKTTLTKAQIPAGMELKVYKISNDGKKQEVNLKKTIFKDNEKFVVTLRTNLPGYVEVINKNPSNKITSLGKWQVPAFAEVTIPSEGEFSFAGEKGKEQLWFVFYPCKPVNEDTKFQTASRDITIVNSSNSMNVSYNINKSIPVCEYRENGVEYKSDKKVYTVTRDIVLNSGVKNVNYSYEDGSNYYVTKIDKKNIKPVVAVIEIIH